MPDTIHILNVLLVKVAHWMLSNIHSVHVNQVNLRLLKDGRDEQSINKHPQQTHDNMKKPYPDQSVLYEKMKRSSAIAEGPCDALCQLKLPIMTQKCAPNCTLHHQDLL